MSRLLQTASLPLLVAGLSACAQSQSPATTPAPATSPTPAAAAPVPSGGAAAAPAAGAARTDTPAQLPADSLEIARRFTRWLYAGHVDSLLAAMPEDQREEHETLRGRIDWIEQNLGVETELVEERWVRRNGKRQYWRTAFFSVAPEKVMLRWVVGTGGELLGMGLNPASQAPAVDPEP
jgi:hypothetical protein